MTVFQAKAAGSMACTVRRRNELVALDMVMTILTMGFAFVAMIAGIFGMNLGPLPIQDDNVRAPGRNMHADNISDGRKNTPVNGHTSTGRKIQRRQKIQLVAGRDCVPSSRRSQHAIYPCVCLYCLASLLPPADHCVLPAIACFISAHVNSVLACFVRQRLACQRVFSSCLCLSSILVCCHADTLLRCRRRLWGNWLHAVLWGTGVCAEKAAAYFYSAERLRPMAKRLRPLALRLCPAAPAALDTQSCHELLVFWP